MTVGSGGLMSVLIAGAHELLAALRRFEFLPAVEPPEVLVDLLA